MKLFLCGLGMYCTASFLVLVSLNRLPVCNWFPDTFPLLIDFFYQQTGGGIFRNPLEVQPIVAALSHAVWIQFSSSVSERIPLENTCVWALSSRRHSLLRSGFCVLYWGPLTDRCLGGSPLIRLSVFTLRILWHKQIKTQWKLRVCYEEISPLW